MKKLAKILRENLVLKTQVPFKIRDIHKIEKKNCIGISASGYEDKQKYPIYVSINTFKRHTDLLLITEAKRHYVLINDFNTLIYDHSLHRGRKHFYRYCLQAFSTTEILKSHVNDYFKINGKQMRKMPKKVNMLDSKIIRGK